MTIFLFLLRRFWKPLTVLAIALVIFSVGYMRAKRVCQEANLKAEISALQHQATVAETILEQAASDGEARARENQLLTKKVEVYEALVDDAERCILSDDDARRLRDIR